MNLCDKAKRNGKVGAILVAMDAHSPEKLIAQVYLSPQEERQTTPSSLQLRERDRSGPRHHVTPPTNIMIKLNIFAWLNLPSHRRLLESASVFHSPKPAACYFWSLSCSMFAFVYKGRPNAVEHGHPPTFAKKQGHHNVLD